MIADDTDFAQLTGAYRGELLAYCYRMLGSAQDAEDQVQEIMLRAWRARDSYEGRASIRTWLYRIATNTCLRALENKARRPLPSGLGAPAEAMPAWPLREEQSVPWLEPVPDALVTAGLTDPAEIVAARSSVRLALIAALQYLPARQRAVLILRDVLGWHADEVAGLLGTSATAVNSALQRARTQLERAAPSQDQMTDSADAATRAIVDRFAAAFESADVAALARLLRDDVTLEMPPNPLWLRGHDIVTRFLGARVLGGPREWRMVPVAANGQLGFASYLRTGGTGGTGDFRAHSIKVLTAGPDGVSRFVSFIDPALFPLFECKDVLDIHPMPLCGLICQNGEMLSYSSGAAAAPLLGETIGANFDAAVRDYGERLALVDRPAGRRWTYAELAADVDALARGLLGLGVATGDRVGIWAPNCAEWMMTQYATAKIGAILVNINPAYRTSELAYVLNQSGARLLIAAERFKTSDYADMIEQVRPRCAALEFVALLGSAGWHALFDRDSTAGFPALDIDDPINIQYTSGTTGFPKGATLSHHNILNNGYFVGELLGYGPDDRICVPVPFYHCFGMVMGNLAATSHGACVVIPAPSFDPELTLEAVAAERCTSLYGVPTMFIAELSAGGFGAWDLSSLRTGIMAGSPCPAEVMKQVMDRMSMPEVSICYGMTETSPVSTQTRRDDSVERRVATVGRVGPHLEVKVIDPATGAMVVRGEPGELCTRGYSVMLGYWGMPEETAAAVDQAGWMHTGDLAVMDADGYLAIVGRLKDMVIRGGENVYPREIEEFLYTHPDVLDAQVIGVPDRVYGEELMAWVRLRPGSAPLTAESLRDYCAGKLAHYKIPRYVHVVDEFPMTVTGKVRKVEMREMARSIIGTREA